MKFKTAIKLKLVLPALALAALLAPSALAATPAAAAGHAKYSVYGSCDNSAPYKASRHCHYDKARLFRATFVFRSHVGKRPLKSCFRLYGRPPFHGGKCSKLAPTAYKAYPFKVSGIRARFAVKVTWFVKPKGGGGWKRAGASFMKVRP